MSTIRERVAAPLRVPAGTMWLLGSLQDAMFDRRALLIAGDALAEAVDASGEHEPSRCSPHGCPIRAALDRWAEVTGPER